MPKKECNNLEKCNFEKTIDIIWWKWKIKILWMLRENKMRPSEMQRKIFQITQKMLTQQLRELEKDGLVWRKSYLVIPPKVEYFLTPKWKSIVPVLTMLDDWWEENIK